METRHERIGEVTVVELIGQRLDAASAAVFKSQMVDLINQGHLVYALDFTRLEFMDSTGLGALIASLKFLGGKGDMVLYGMSPNLRKIFAVTRLDRGVFRIFESKEEALAALAGRPQ